MRNLNWNEGAFFAHYKREGTLFGHNWKAGAYKIMFHHLAMGWTFKEKFLKGQGSIIQLLGIQCSVCGVSWKIISDNLIVQSIGLGFRDEKY